MNKEWAEELTPEEIRIQLVVETGNEIPLDYLIDKGHITTDSNSYTFENLPIRIGGEQLNDVLHIKENADSGKRYAFKETWDTTNDQMTLTVKNTKEIPTPSPGTPSKEKYTLIFDFNRGNETDQTAGNGSDRMIWEVEKGEVISIPSAPSREGYTFLYWKGSKYYPGDTYTVTGDHTFIAIWEKDEEEEPDTNKPGIEDPNEDQLTPEEIDKILDDILGENAVPAIPVIPKAGAGR